MPLGKQECTISGHVSSVSLCSLVYIYTYILPTLWKLQARYVVAGKRLNPLAVYEKTRCKGWLISDDQFLRCLKNLPIPAAGISKQGLGAGEMPVYHRVCRLSAVALTPLECIVPIRPVHVTVSTRLLSAIFLHEHV